MQVRLTQLIVESSGSYYTQTFYYANNMLACDMTVLNSWSAAEQWLQDRTIQLVQNLSGAGATNIQAGTLDNYGTYKKQNISFDLQVSDTIDYTQVLTDINTNLSNLNTNITNKNNQSDIVDCLNNIFCYTYSSGSNKSVLKDESLANTDTRRNNLNICHLLFCIYVMFNSSNSVSLDNLQSGPLSNRALDNISKKLFNIDVASINNASVSRSDLCSRIYYLIQTLVASVSNTTDNIISNSLLKQISDKLANANDLHTISQAIDLISTAIAQLPATDTTGLQTELGKISTAVNNIENNPLFELNANVNGIEVCKKNNKNELDF